MQQHVLVFKGLSESYDIYKGLSIKKAKNMKDLISEY